MIRSVINFFRSLFLQTKVVSSAVLANACQGSRRSYCGAKRLGGVGPLRNQIHRPRTVRYPINESSQGTKDPPVRVRCALCLALHDTSRGSLCVREKMVNIRMSSFKVLVVEDHEAFCGLIISIVQKADFQVVGKASDGLEAIQKAEELQPDLILLDIGLPNLNGIEVARRLRKTAPHIKILFVSQESSIEIVQETLDLGALGYVHKSQVQSDLVLAIESVLDGRQFVSSAAKRAELSESAKARTPRFHEMLAYSDDADLLESFTRFIAAALRAGNPTMVVATEPHWGNIFQRLAKEGVAIHAALQEGTCIWLDSADTPDPVRLLSSIKDLVEVASDAARAGDRRVAICGELAGRMWAEGRVDVAFQFEQACNDLVKHVRHRYSLRISSRPGYRSHRTKVPETLRGTFRHSFQIKTALR